MGTDPKAYIEQLHTLDDSDIKLGEAAIMLAALQQPGISTERYIHHLKKMSEEAAERYAELLEAGAQNNVQTQLAALKHIISDKHAYIGDIQTFDDIQNANLIRVIDRAMGISISLAILYIDVAEHLNWHVVGLDIPGHYMCRIEKAGERIIFDPFDECRVLGAPEIRQRLKETIGEDAELSAEYFEPQTKRTILIGLQNNIKYRQITVEDYKGALEVVETMRIIDPDEYRILLDAGVLYAKVNEPQSAIKALERYIEKAPDGRDRQEAEMLLYEMRRALN